MEFIKYPSIEQFRSIVRQVQSMTAYQGKDEDGNAVYDNTIPLPTLTFTGSVKIHGTNAGVCYDYSTGEMWAQSRKNIITPEKDNMGFAFFVEANKDVFMEIFNKYKPYVPQNKILTIFGEWCGGNIQKGVAVSVLDKMFVAFQVIGGSCEYPLGDVTSISANIYNIEEFPTYMIDIDFNNPEKAVNKMTEITEAVEAECPVGKYFGVSGIGEGVVWETTYKGQHLNFKVKGEKHSATKVKKLVKVDVEKIASIDAFVEYAVTENRLNQGIEQVFTIEGTTPDIKQMGPFLKWVMGDICKEEVDTLVENGLEPKDVSRSINQKAREWFMGNYWGE